MASNEKEIIFLIADLAGYTAFTEAHGDNAAVGIIQKFINIVRSSLTNGVELKERIGDEVLIVGSNASGVANTAIDLCKKAEKELNFPGMHIGIHKGKVLEMEGNYFGSTLNLTSRIADYSREGQIICSGTFKASLADNTDFIFHSLGQVRFKNYSVPMDLYELNYQRSAINKFVDPVCKMQLYKENAPAKLPYFHKTYFFCSFDCASKFSKNPMGYLERMS